MNICNGVIINISNIDISNIDHRCISKIAQDFIFDCSNERKTLHEHKSVTPSMRRVTRYSWKNLAPTRLSNVGGYPSETHLKIKSRKISLANNIPFRLHMFWYFAQTMSVSPLCNVQYFKTIEQVWNKLYMGKRDFAWFEFKIRF